MKKYMLRRRILALILVSIILLFTISVPISAVVNGSVVPDNSTSLYGISSFPYTVGFVMADQNTNYNYIFATSIGGYGQNNNQVYEGDDEFQWYYPNQSASETSAIRYNNVTNYYNQSYLHWYHNGPNGGSNDYYGGWVSMDLEFDTVTSDFVGICDSIVFKASQVFYNPIWLFHQTTDWDYVRADRTDPVNFMMPSFTLPPTTSSQKFVGRFNVQVYITDVDGEGQWHQYSVPIDTSTNSNIVNDPISFISYDVLASYVGDIQDYEDLESWDNEVIETFQNTTIMIDEYRGFLDVDYYELENGSWVKKDYSLNHNKVSVTYPLYNAAGVTDPDDTLNMWFSFPYASKYVDSVVGLDPKVDVLPEIPEEMYRDYTGWLTTAVGGFMNMQFAPGITLGGIVGVLVMLGCVMWMLKIFAGG